MELRSIVYPAPDSSYMPDNEGLEFGNVMYIKKDEVFIEKGEEFERYIPNLLIRYDGRYGGSSKVLLFFHGNAEDVGLAEDLLHHLSESLEVHVIGVEYPGYGVYRDLPSSEEIIKQDALRVYEYLTEEFGLDEK